MDVFTLSPGLDCKSEPRVPPAQAATPAVDCILPKSPS